MSRHGNKSFNDKMVGRTVLPSIYLWLASCAAVVGMGIAHPDVVLANLDGFIALIAIIGNIAGPALSTILRMWEAEQTTEIKDLADQLEHERTRDSEEHNHQMVIEKHGNGIDPTLYTPRPGYTDSEE